MTVVSYKNRELLAVTGSENPPIFAVGVKVIFSEITLSKSDQNNLLQIFQELGKIFQKYSSCLSDIPINGVLVESINPLCFQVLQSFTLRSANRDSWLFAPLSHFAFQKIKFTHTVDPIFRGNIPVNPLFSFSSKTLSKGIENVSYQGHDGLTRTFHEMLLKTDSDAIVILRDGKVVYEKYFNGQSHDTPHIEFSVTKSLVAIIVTQLICNKIINPYLLVREYISELAETAFGDARVIDVLDMTTGIHYNEEYTNPESDVRRHMIAASYLNQSSEYRFEKTSRTFLKTLKKEGEHGRVFHYVSANTEVLSWLVEKATHLTGCMKTVNELFSELIWSKLGPEHDAFIIKDSVGDASWAGGFNATTRDMARVGQMILNNGTANNQELISSEVFEFMRQRDMRPQFAASETPTLYPVMKGWSYANQFWWTHNEHGAFTAIGIYGQVLYIDPKAKVVIAKNSSHPEPEGQWVDDETFLAIHALSKGLMREKTPSKL